MIMDCVDTIQCAKLDDINTHLQSLIDLQTLQGIDIHLLWIFIQAFAVVIVIWVSYKAFMSWLPY